MNRRRARALGVALGMAILATLPVAAAEVETIDWSAVPKAKPRLFYPGQSSLEWLATAEHKKADKEVREGEACLRCHKGEQKSLGEILVAENRLEPVAIEGKDGYKRLTIRGFTALAVEALRDLRDEKDAEIAELRARVERLESLESELDAMRAQLAGFLGKE